MNESKQKVAVVTDSAAALTCEQVSTHGLSVARMEIVIDGITFDDSANGELDEFYSLLSTSETIPTTSAPKPSEYLEQFRTAASSGQNVFCVTVSAKLSAAYDAANVAAELFTADHPGLEVRVFDSGAAASSQALIVLAVARAAESGRTIDEVEAVAKQVAGKVRLVAMLDTLRFIYRSGRVPKIAVWATNALNIKPVMEFSAARIGAIARPRSVARAIKRIQREMANDLDGKPAHINVVHAGAPERAELLRTWAAEYLDCAELFVTQFHPFMGAHSGPGLVGASWWAEG
ncbi:DegV family protein [Dehalococcoides mccartyi]|nr:DegV family protein [Dehalococcoides mccartyi]